MPTAAQKRQAAKKRTAEEEDKTAPEKKACSVCGQAITVLKNGDLRQHVNPETKEHCLGGRQPKDSGIEEKAKRYVTEGRVKVVYARGSDIICKVQGSAEEPYTVRWNNGTPICNCEAQVWHCAHVAATFLVVEPKGTDAGPPTEIDQVLEGPEANMPDPDPETNPSPMPVPAPEPVLPQPPPSPPPVPDPEPGLDISTHGAAGESVKPSEVMTDNLDEILGGTTVAVPTTSEPVPANGVNVDELLAMFDEEPVPATRGSEPEADYPADGPP